MSKQGDYLPQQEAVLIDWGDNFAAEITAHGTEWEIPAAEVSGVTTALAAFKTLHTQAASPERNRVIVEEKNEARDAFKAKVRAMVKFRFENPIITNADRVRCGRRTAVLHYFIHYILSCYFLYIYPIFFYLRFL
ncbi:MAG: hypothetical protein LBP81_05805 [Treponema sp.]|nr:hypothetical protein [Treponema sp.]